MEKFQDTVLVRTNGVMRPMAGALVYVRVNTTQALATLYSDDGVTTTNNPTTTDTAGFYSFFAANGLYDISIVKSGFDTVTRTRVEIIDESAIQFADLAGFPTDNAALAESFANVLTAAGYPTAAYLLDRTHHTGDSPAANIVRPTGETQEAFNQRIELALASPGTSDPTVDTDPSLAGTVGVGNTLTATLGTVTDGSGGAHTDIVTWVRQDPNTSLETIIKTGTSVTYVQVAADVGSNIFVTQQAQDTATLRLSNKRTSNIKGPVTGTAPTNSVAPALSPTGSQTAGTTITCSTGTWTGASTYQYQFLLVGAIVQDWSSTATFTGTASQIGALTANVRGIASDGVVANPVATSNTVTLTGTSLVNTAVGQWPANVYLEQTATLVEGTWTLGGVSVTPTVVHDFYRSRSGGALTLYRSGNTGLLHTPHAAPHPDALVAGDVLSFTSTPTYNSVTYPAVSSGTVTLEATPVAFAVQITSAGSTGYLWTNGTAITQSTVATISGGTTPYLRDTTADVNKPSWLTVTISGTSVILSGTPSATASSTTVTLGFKDSAGTPATGTVSFTYQVSATGVTQLTALPMSASSTTGPGTGSWDGTGQLLSSVSGVYAFEAVADPSGGGSTVHIHRIHQNYGVVAGGQRCEITWPNSAQQLAVATDHWFAVGIMRKSGENSSSELEHLVWQTHTWIQGATNPEIEIDFDPHQSALRIYRSWSVDAPNGDQMSTKGNATDYTGTIPAVGVWAKFIIHFRPGWTAAHAPATEIWYSLNGGAYTKIVNKVSTGSTLNTNFFPNEYNTTGSGVPAAYSRKGPYCWDDPIIGTTLAYYITPQYYGAGTNKYAEAEAALASLRAV